MASPEGRRATPAARPPPEQGLRCPRCDSSNTKFCYYNNYSLTQPRHFCKACRRYWTKGGALRNVPVGGGCRKNKKSKASATTFAGVGLGGGFHQLPQLPDQKCSQVDQLFPFSKLSSSPSIGGAGHVYNQFLTFGDLSPSPMACAAGSNIVASSSGSSLDQSGGAIAVAQPPIMGFKPFDPAMSSPSPSIRQAYAGRISQETGAAPNMQINDIASSIESLSSMNQDLHFKLQQQRFALMLAGGINPRDPVSNSASMVETQQIHQLPISFHGSNSSKNGACGVEMDDKMQLGSSDNQTELLLDQSSYPSATDMQSWTGLRQFN